MTNLRSYRTYVSFFDALYQPPINSGCHFSPRGFRILGLHYALYSVFMVADRARHQCSRFGTIYMITTTPPIGILIDLPFGLLMWTSFVHFLLIIVMNEDSGFSLFRLLRGLNAPIYAAISLIKPAFIISRLLPLYAAVILFIIRYYILPLALGFDVWSFDDMPLERLLLSAKSDLSL